jgi:hypothetical protein
MMLDKTGDVRIVLKHKHGLGQQIFPRLAIRPGGLVFKISNSHSGHSKPILE